MQTFTVHQNKAALLTFHVLKTIIMLLPDSMGYITRATTIIRHVSAQLLKDPDGGFQLHIHGIPQEVCVIISPFLPSKFYRAEPTGQGPSCCYEQAVTALAITHNNHQNDMCQTMLLIHKANLWSQGKNWHLMAFHSIRQTFLFFFNYTFILQMYFFMPMKWR